MTTPTLVEWQKIDEENGLVMPWLTHPFLDWLKQQDWSDKNVIMFGAGLGDAWLAKRCKHLTVVERNDEWLIKAAEYSGQHGTFIHYIHRPCNDSSGMQDYYLEMPDDRVYDVIINDDAYRTELCQVAIDYLKKHNGGILVADNWQQDYVWISPIAEELMKPYKLNIFVQSNHTDHEGRPWNTVYWEIPPTNEIKHNP